MQLRACMSIAKIAKQIPLVADEVQDVVKTDWAHLVDTNYVAVSLEEQSGLQCAISRMSNVLVDLEAVIADLLESRRILENCMLQHSRFVSIVGRLPPEILSDIFLRSALIEYSARDRHDGLSPKGRNLSLNVAHVCRRWRSIALSTPNLWGLIHLKADESSHSCTSIGTQYSELLQRTRLSHFHLVAKTSDELVLACKQGQLEPFRDRCHRLDVGAQISAKWDDILATIERFTDLKQLSLRCSSSQASGFPSLLTCDLPHLTHLRVRLPVGNSPNLLSIFLKRWDNLTCLVLDGFRWWAAEMELEIRDFFGNFPNLEELFLITDLQLLGVGDNDNSESPVCVSAAHPKLKVLCLYADSMSSRALATFLRCVSLPNLEQLILPTIVMDDLYIDSFSAFVTHSGCHLRSVTLLYGHFPPPSWQKMAQTVHDITHAECVDCVGEWNYSDIFMAIEERWYAPYIAIEDRLWKEAVRARRVF